MNILLIDDDNENVELLRRTINKIDSRIKVYDACNGEEALDILSIIKINFLILDLLMPVMNGDQFLKEFKQMNLNIPFLVVSSGLLNSNIGKYFEMGAIDCIRKPFYLDLFDQKIKRYICG